MERLIDAVILFALDIWDWLIGDAPKRGPPTCLMAVADFLLLMKGQEMIPKKGLDTPITRANIVVAQVKKAKDDKGHNDDFTPLTAQEIAVRFQRCYTARHVERAKRLIDGKLMAKVAAEFAIATN